MKIEFTYAEQLTVLEQDLLAKFFRRDWHGVADCAMDLREREAEERGRQEVRDDQARKAKAVHSQKAAAQDGARQMHVGSVYGMRQSGTQETLPSVGLASVDSPLG